MTACPVCGELGGFHSDVHLKLAIPRHLLLEKDWLKKYLDEQKKINALIMRNMSMDDSEFTPGEFAYVPEEQDLPADDSGTPHLGHIFEDGRIYDITDPAGLVEYMQRTTSHADWGRRCDEIKKSLNGNYPDIWWPTIVQSGLMDAILGQGASQIKIYSFGPKN